MSSRPSVFLSHTYTHTHRIDLGCVRVWEVTTRWMAQSNQRYPIHITSCSAIRRRGERLGRLSIFCSGTVCASVYLWEVVSDWLGITCFFLFPFSSLLLLLDYLYLDPQAFWFSVFLCFSPIPLREDMEKWASSCVVLTHLLGLTPAVRKSWHSKYSGKHEYSLLVAILCLAQQCLL